ncbi:uncharacterized protein MYCFIDRAFT_175073 [Pseudocercospora fijiensis CIRAD86]|uniref:Uncharacterized protein n=1 Tax=Pseudocercospora fijiensis (strain CIRAD86) TaxID=383855 RepID=M2Z1E2_PSEFD|nr:uncharacterized protein MYCFIDRAFT_175073 [Pseudocercospora fijiensis CIRAD86]EME83645.1 hypothetical protein MYCFIDRAFT_175073 [Pseudocercospora fijiensis CIRAD86]
MDMCCADCVSHPDLRVAVLLAFHTVLAAKHDTAFACRHELCFSRSTPSLSKLLQPAAGSSTVQFADSVSCRAYDFTTVLTGKLYQLRRHTTTALLGYQSVRLASMDETELDPIFHLRAYHLEQPQRRLRITLLVKPHYALQYPDVSSSPTNTTGLQGYFHKTGLDFILGAISKPDGTLIFQLYTKAEHTSLRSMKDGKLQRAEYEACLATKTLAVNNSRQSAKSSLTTSTAPPVIPLSTTQLFLNGLVYLAAEYS